MLPRNALPPILDRGFYRRDVDEVARDLLGCHLVHRTGRRIVGGRIVEVEAYGGPGDPGSHADKSPNGRARIMFGPPGIAYVYFTYGMHFCMNAVTSEEGRASAVLLRAVEPLWGIEWMRERGAPESLPDRLLASGPGRVCRALDVSREHNGTDLTGGPVLVRDRTEAPDEIFEGERIGLSRDDGRRWRFWISSPSFSRGRTGTGRRGRRTG